MRIIFAVIALSSLSSCASIVSRSVYSVTLDTEPSGAEVVIRDHNNNVVHRGTTPTTANLNASSGFFTRARYSIEANLPGYSPGRKTVEATIDGWYFGNLLFGGMIGFLAVDPATGAMWRIDERFTVRLAPAPAPALASEATSPPACRRPAPVSPRPR